MAVEPDSCQVCPRRLDTQDGRRGYCEGCPSRLRRCLVCGQWRKQVEWGWGFDRTAITFPLVRFVCSSCKAQQPTDLPGRFTAMLGMDGRVRARLADELALSAGRLEPHPRVGPVMRELARQVAAGAELDVDLDGLDARDRRWVLKTIRDCTNRLQAAHADAAEELTRKWSWVCEGPPEPSTATVVASSPAADAQRLGWERPA